MASLWILFVSFFIVTFHQVSPLGILSSDSFQTGNSFTATCSPDAVGLSDVNQDNIFSMELSRQTYSSSEPTTIYFVDVKNILSDIPGWEIKNIPSSKDWDIQHPTRTELLNNKFKRSVMKVTLTLNDVTCEDSGHYMCIIKYFTSTKDETKMESEAINETASAFRMKVIPNYGSLEAVYIYDANQTIEVTCFAKAPEDYNFYWKRKCPDRNPNPSFNLPSRFVQWPVRNDIKEHKKEIINNGDQPNQCGMYNHSQMLIFKMSEDIDGCMVKCEFGESEFSSQKMDSNITFLLDQVTDKTAANSSPSSASNKDLIIGLTVSLLLLAIIIGAVLIYVFWWRKRKPREKYKDETDVRSDADNNHHAPPSMVYSKPYKPPKHDARGDNKEKGNKDRNTSYEDNDDDELPPKAYYNNSGEKNYPMQTHSSNRPRSKRHSQRGSGDYYNYEDGECKDDSRNRRSYGDGNPYASTDISRSEDEFESGHPRPKPKRRTKLPAKEDEPKELHYADLDLPMKSRDDDKYREEREGGGGEHRGRYNRNRRNRKSRGHEDEEEELPIQYASIRV